jgi:SAM-dependent methyltransferase
MAFFSRVLTRLQRIAGRREFDVGRRFSEIYEKNLFNGDESRSGKGSSLTQTERLRRELPALLRELGVRTFLDAPCGDCHWIADFDWATIGYTGVDVVPALVEANRVRLKTKRMEFTAADLCADPLPRADLIFCRDCWVHLTFRQVQECLANFRRSGAEYLLTTTFERPGPNVELQPGMIWRPLNRQEAPFRFPRPLRLLLEHCTEEDGRFADKALGLWRLPDLKAD